MCYAKVIQKKEESEEKKYIYIYKWTQKCLRYLKQWVLRCPPKKEKK
jgi:hypothetical protein